MVMMMGIGGWRRLMMRWSSRPFVVVVGAGLMQDVYDIKKIRAQGRWQVPKSRYQKVEH